MENGFKIMSQHADDEGSETSSAERAASVAARLKTYGVDTEQMTDVASERVSELQQIVSDEVRARPLRALGWAAAAGVVVGFWASR